VEIYDTEEEQVAAIKRWWKENGASTIIGIAVGVIIIGGWNFWQSYTQDKAKQASALYEEVLASVSNEKTESVEKITERITEQYGSTAYATYAALLLAKTKVQQGDVESAKSIFEKQMKVADSAELRNVARIRLVKLMLATDENEKGLQTIAEVDQSSSQGFSASYDELTGDLYLALGRLGEARTAYQSALRAGSNSPLLQFKLDDITAAEIIETNSELKTESVQ
jgi:predicted negative regulator of RcsB-dependent stress response